MPIEIEEAVSSSSASPCRFELPEATIADAGRHIAATRFADKELVPDQSQGVQLATIQELARYWAYRVVGSDPTVAWVPGCRGLLRVRRHDRDGSRVFVASLRELPVISRVDTNAQCRARNAAESVTVR